MCKVECCPGGGTWGPRAQPWPSSSTRSSPCLNLSPASPTCSAPQDYKRGKDLVIVEGTTVGGWVGGRVSGWVGGCQRAGDWLASWVFAHMYCSVAALLCSLPALPLCQCILKAFSAQLLSSPISPCNPHYPEVRWTALATSWSLMGALPRSSTHPSSWCARLQQPAAPHCAIAGSAMRCAALPSCCAARCAPPCSFAQGPLFSYISPSMAPLPR
jgi:hypothetical protein